MTLHSPPALTSPALISSHRAISLGLVLVALLALVAGCKGSVSPPAPPEAVATPSVVEARPAGNWTAGAMVSAANPMAVDAGLAILAQGGSAVDAAIAVQAVLGLVEPQSSGIGGGAFMLHYDARTGDVVAYDGREVAPQGATPDMFMGTDGKPLGFGAAVRTGRSIGVPGAVAMLELAHREHGQLAWNLPWQPAIELATAGFSVPPRMAQMIRAAQGFGGLAPDAAAYLAPGGSPLVEGQQLQNVDYANTLQQIAKEGARSFYEGPLATAIVAAATREPTPGTLSLADLKAYQPTRLEPVCRGYRAYLVCGMRPPSSGGIAVLSILGTLENIDMTGTNAREPLGWHYFIEAQRLAYADRDMYVADDRFVRVPLEGLLDGPYLRARAALITPDRALASVAAGTPPGAVRQGSDTTGGTTGTSHFVVVDNAGNVVSMTTTVESVFGSQRMAGGFFLNNQLTDFSFRPTDDEGRPIANAVAPGKKPRSSMSPTIVFENGGFRFAVGSPGGNAIIGYVAKAIVGTLDWKLAPQAAIDLPNVVARGPIAVELTRMDPAIVTRLREMGHTFREGGGGEGSGLHAVLLDANGQLVGAADSRRDGVAKALER